MTTKKQSDGGVKLLEKTAVEFETLGFERSLKSCTSKVICNRYSYKSSLLNKTVKPSLQHKKLSH